MFRVSRFRSSFVAVVVMGVRMVRQQRVRVYGMSVCMRMMRVMRARAVYDLCPPKDAKGFRKSINNFLLGVYRVI